MRVQTKLELLKSSSENCPQPNSTTSDSFNIESYSI